MIVCPKCASKTKVLDTRSIDGKAVRRRRCCTNCGFTFKTFETMANTYVATKEKDVPKRRGRPVVKMQVKGDAPHDQRLREWQDNQVCYCDLCNAEVPDDVDITVKSNGIVFYFCCEGHKDAFFHSEIASGDKR